MAPRSLPGRLRRALNRGLRPLGLELGREAPFLRRSRAWSPPRRALAAMTPAMRAPTPVPAGEATEAGELHQIWKRSGGSVKYHHYFPVYEELAAPLRGRAPRMLEIGVMRGAGLAMWSDYLGPGAVVVGLDIEPTAARFEDAAAGRLVRIGDQSDPAFLRAVIDEFGSFDLIIDDGSHVASHMIASFNHLFMDGLAPGGAYLAEDTHTNYWTGLYRDGPYSFVQYARDLADLVNWHHALCDSYAFTLGRAERRGALELPRIAAELREVRFLDSLVAFRRAAAPALPVMEITVDDARS